MLLKGGLTAAAFIAALALVLTGWPTAAAALLAALAALLLFTGDSRVSGTGERTDALKSVAENIDQEIHAAIADIRGLTDSMTQDAEKLLGVAATTSGNATSAAAAATEAMANAETVSSATEEMHASINEIALQAVQSRDIACKAVAMAENTQAMVSALHAATGTVEAIVGIINNIAARTDLLALNAAVEAARAGGAGKGFAVVAGEVKRLANQTQDATVDIGNRIAEMRLAAAQVGTAIDAVAAVIREVEVIAGSISSAAEQQTAATSEISRAVAEVSVASTGVADLAESLSGAASLAQELAEEVRADSGRMTETVGGLGRALSRVVRTSHRDMDRRRHPRFGTLLNASVAVGGTPAEVSVTDFGPEGCALVFPDRTLARSGQAVQVVCADFGPPRNGSIVATDGLVAHVRFATGDTLDGDLVDRLATAGSRLIIDKAKSDHRAFVQSVRAVVEGRATLKSADLANHHTCRLGKWYDRVVDPRILTSPVYRSLMEPHVRVHQAGKEALNAFHSGDRHAAGRAVERLKASSEEVIAMLDQLGREVAAH
ncbi:MAG: methyl-accepting chemotaxis protein [Actinomycetota bacterium]